MIMKHNILSFLAIGMIFLALGFATASCQDYNSDINDNKEAAERLDSAYSSLSSDVSMLTQQLEYAKKEATTSHAKLAEAIQNLKDLQNSGFATKEYVDAQDAVIKAAAEAAAADAKVDAVKEAKEYADSLLTQAKELMNNYASKTAVDALVQQMNSLNAKVTALTSDITELQDNDKSLQNQIDAAEEKIDILQNTCDKYGETLDGLEGLVDDLDSLKNISDSLKSYLEQVKSIIENSGNSGELITALQEVKDQVTAVLGDIDILKEFVVKNLKSVDLVPEYFDAAAPGGYVICYNIDSGGTESEETEATWEVNPVGANLQGAKYEIVHRTVRTRAAADDDTVLVKDLSVEVNDDTSRIVTKFKVNIGNLEGVNNTDVYDLVALRITLPVYGSDEKQIVKSPYYAIMERSSISLKTPENEMSVDVHSLDEEFPCKFSWTTIPDYDDYVLKVSSDQNFDADKTFTDTLRNAAEYEMTAEELIKILKNYDRKPTMHLYWTVVPAGTSFTKTEVRSITVLCPPTLIGDWEFDNASDLCKATVGNDLIPNGGTLTALTDSATAYNGRIPTGSGVLVPRAAYLKCIHQLQDPRYVTVAMWIKTPIQGKVYHLIECDQPDSPNSPELRINNLRLSFSVNFNDIKADYFIGGDTWHQIFYVTEKDNHKVYVDGYLESEYNASTSTSKRHTFNDEAVSFFGVGNGENQDIQVAQLKMWDMPMTVDEIYKAMGQQQVPKSDMSIVKYLETLDPAAGTPEIMIDNSLLGTCWSGRFPSDPSNTNFDSTHKFLFTEDQETYAVIDLGQVRKIREVGYTTRVWGGSNAKTVKMYIGNSYDNKSEMTEAVAFQRSDVSSRVTGVWNFAWLPEAISGRYLMLDVTEIYNHNFGIGEVLVVEDL